MRLDTRPRSRTQPEGNYHESVVLRKRGESKIKLRFLAFIFGRSSIPYPREGRKAEKLVWRQK